ncbi:MAG TPA: hypothetical protein PKA64_16440, partial [Myxococcota bacterium]|nr:hypothetical protein [Myxococcota bacterium]
MGRLLFEDPRTTQAQLALRADVACFVGFVARRGDTVPWEVASWLWARGWQRPWLPDLTGFDEGDQVPLSPHAGLPIPIESWEAFDALFAWDARPLDDGGTLGATWIGGAVRSFFAQGGRRCYVVAAGDPWTYRSVASPRG